MYHSKTLEMAPCEAIAPDAGGKPQMHEPSACEGAPKTLPATTGFLRYPTGRDQFLKTPQRWLDGKRIDDDVAPYWRVHDKLYDLSTFLDKHPGGYDWLLATQGTDITELFESSHISTAAESLLPKFYVKDATTPRNSPFTFHEDGFYRKFKSKARKILARVGTGPSRAMLMIMDGLTITFIALSLSAAVTQSIFLSFLAGICLSLVTMASHNFSHQRDSWRMYTYDLTLMSSYDWRVSHVLSHHPFPNTFYDVEIAKLEPILQLLPRPDKNFVQRYCVCFYELFVIPIYVFATALKKYYLVISGEEKFRPEYLLPGVELLVMAVVSPSLWGALKIWLLIHTWNSCTYGYFALTLSHHHPDTYHEGDMAREQPDWGLIQLDATRDRAEVKGNLFLVAITLGDHSLHHLLPSVDHSKLPYIYPVLFEMCEEYNIPYRFYSQWEMFKGKYRALANNVPSTQPPGYKPIQN